MKPFYQKRIGLSTFTQGAYPSEHSLTEMQKAGVRIVNMHLKRHGREFAWLPCLEVPEVTAINILAAVEQLWTSRHDGDYTYYIHCAAGINRSHLVYSCLLFLESGDESLISETWSGKFNLLPNGFVAALHAMRDGSMLDLAIELLGVEQIGKV